MKKILIADSSKPSIVMTSEVFKDHFVGVQVLIAKNGLEAIEVAKLHGDLDAVVVDYDLPDQLGSTVASQLKKMIAAPVLITAFEDPEVTQDIETRLAAYDDCLNWIRKPIRAEKLAEVAKRFCEGKIRTHRRILCEIPIQIKLDLEPILIKKDLGKKNTTKQIDKRKAEKKSLVQKKESTQKPLKKMKQPVAKQQSKEKTQKDTVKKTKKTKEIKKKIISKQANQIVLPKRKIRPKLVQKKTTSSKEKQETSRSASSHAPALKGIWTPASLEDCSIHGLKVSVHLSTLKELGSSGLLGAGKKQLASGQAIQIKIPALAFLKAQLPQVVLEASPKSTGHGKLAALASEWIELPAHVVWCKHEKDLVSVGLHAKDSNILSELFQLLAHIEILVREKSLLPAPDSAGHKGARPSRPPKEGEGPQSSAHSGTHSEQKSQGVPSLSGFSSRARGKRDR